MVRLSNDIVDFFQKQSFVIVSTLDDKKQIHCSAKGIVKILPEGKVFVIDLYRAKTFKNLMKNPTISITAIDEHRFIGYTLKGKAKITKIIDKQIIKDWHTKVIKRISKRVIKNIKDDNITGHQPETKFPEPKFLIEIDVEEIVNLAPNFS